MKNKLPVLIEDNELPKFNSYKSNNQSYGYVNILYLSSIIITVASVLTVIILGNR